MKCYEIVFENKEKQTFGTKEIMVLVSIKCALYEIFGKDKETVPRNRKVAQTSLNIHLIMSGI